MKAVYLTLTDKGRLGQVDWYDACCLIEGILIKYTEVRGAWSTDCKDPVRSAIWCVQPMPHLTDEFEGSLLLAQTQLSGTEIMLAPALITAVRGMGQDGGL